MDKKNDGALKGKEEIMEEEEMQREDIFDCCGEIFDQFENPNPQDDELTMLRFVEGITRPDVDFLSQVFEKSELKLEGKTAEDVFFDFFGMVVVLSFGMGFGMGTWRECPDPKVRERIKKVHATIEERGLFHYTSRARA